MQEQRAHLRNVFFIKKFCGCRKVLDLFSHSANGFSGDVFMEQQVDKTRWKTKFCDDAKLIVEARSSRCNISAVTSPTHSFYCDYLVKAN